MSAIGKLVCGLALATVASGVAVSKSEGTPPLPVPFQEDFAGSTLSPEWTVDVSNGNAVHVKKGVLEIRAARNTFAHIQRPLGVDFVRVSCEIRPAPAITWCTSLFVYWDAGNWCQLGIIDRGGGTYYALEMIDGKAHEFDLGRCAFDSWHGVAIELGADCVRYLSSEDGATWRTEATHRRPDEFARTPELLVVGKGHGGPAGYPAPDLNNDYASREQTGTSYVRGLRVETTEWSRLRETSEERTAREAAFLDTAGEHELAREDDPSFDSVSRYYPAMKLPREVVGVKEHPDTIGVAADGALQLNNACFETSAPIAFFEIGTPPYRFGSGTSPCRKRLLNGWMPIVVATDSRDALEFEQTVFGYSEGMTPEAPLFGYVRLKVLNVAAQDARTAIRLRIGPPKTAAVAREWTLEVPPNNSRAIELRLPFRFHTAPVTDIPAAEFDAKLAQVTGCWERLIAPGTRFQIPEPRVQDAYRAWLAYNFLNVHKRDGAYQICDGSGFYNEIYGYSAALYCGSLDLMGYTDQSRTYLDALLKLQRPDGLFCVNFGDTDTGVLLVTLANHYRLTGDAEWLRAVAPSMVAMCNWIIDRRKESTASVHGKRTVVHGLIRYRPYCDFEAPAADYFSNGYLCVGMEAAADVLGEIGITDEARRFRREANAYRADILTSMDAAVVTHNGMKMLPIMPDTQFLLREANYSANGYYGLVASCVLETGFLAPTDSRADLLVEMLRRRGGLVAGVSQFFDMIDHAYAYGYWMTCLRRDEPKRVILGFYGSMAYGMTRETYAAVECTRVRTGENYWTLPHTYSNTIQLRLLRNMLVFEDGDDLLLGFATPRPWLEPGKRLEVNDAPTLFGPVSFTAEPRDEGREIFVRVTPPTRHPPATIKVRLRRPARAAIRSVETRPAIPHRVEGDAVVLPGLAAPLELTVRY